MQYFFYTIAVVLGVVGLVLFQAGFNLVPNTITTAELTFATRWFVTGIGSIVTGMALQMYVLPRGIGARPVAFAFSVLFILCGTVTIISAAI